jgi:hypothetical protein
MLSDTAFVLREAQRDIDRFSRNVRMSLDENALHEILADVGDFPTSPVIIKRPRFKLRARRSVNQENLPPKPRHICKSKR